jgi:hypothetical protein
LKLHVKFIYSIIIFLGCLCSFIFAKATDNADTTAFSTKAQAIAYIEKITELKESRHWPNIKPALFLANLKLNIYNPLGIYEGTNTNFCGPAAMSYLPLNFDPLGFVTFMVELYNNGEASIRKENFNPSAAIHKIAGTLVFKGVLDVRPADQLWFLCVADHFKGYVNFLNNTFQPGDEDSFWASVNLAKFSGMIKKLYNYNVDVTGADLIRPRIKDLYTFTRTAFLSGGTVFLFLDNRYLTKKNHVHFRPAVPTHFITVLDIYMTGDLITLIYWDYGGVTLRQVTPDFLKKITFGVLHCTKKIHDAK